MKDNQTLNTYEESALHSTSNDLQSKDKSKAVEIDAIANSDYDSDSLELDNHPTVMALIALAAQGFKAVPMNKSIEILSEDIGFDDSFTVSQFVKWVSNDPTINPGIETGRASDVIVLRTYNESDRRFLEINRVAIVDCAIVNRGNHCWDFYFKYPRLENAISKLPMQFKPFGRSEITVFADEAKIASVGAVISGTKLEWMRFAESEVVIPELPEPLLRPILRNVQTYGYSAKQKENDVVPYQTSKADDLEVEMPSQLFGDSSIHKISAIAENNSQPTLRDPAKNAPDTFIEDVCIPDANIKKNNQKRDEDDIKAPLDTETEADSLTLLDTFIFEQPSTNNSNECVVDTAQLDIMQIPDLQLVFGKEHPLVIKQLNDNCKDIDVLQYRNTDISNGKLYADIFKGIILFSKVEKKAIWYKKSGYHFEIDVAQFAQECAKLVSSILRYKAQTIVSEGDKDKTIQHALKLESMTKIKNMVEAAKSDQNIVVKESDWNIDPKLLSVKNGILNLETLQFVYDPLLRIRDHIDINYNPSAITMKYEPYLNSLFEGNEKLIRWIKLYLGYTLTGYTSEQVFILCEGAGNNGKSKFFELVKKLTGSYFMLAPQTMIDLDTKNQFYSGEIHLSGKRFVSLTELNASMRLDEKKIKQFTGEEAVVARGLFEQFIEIPITSKFWFFTNDKPIIRDNSNAMWRRVNIIPFNVRFNEKNENTNIIGELTAKNELEGIFADTIRQANRWIQLSKKNISLKRNLPDIMISAKEKYRSESSPFEQWLGECVTLDAERTESSADLFESYQEFERLNGFDKSHAVKLTSFGKLMSNVPGITKQRPNAKPRITLYKGISINEPPESRKYRNSSGGGSSFRHR